MVCNLSILPVCKQIWKRRLLKTIQFVSRELAPDLPLVCTWGVDVLSSLVDATIYSLMWRTIPLEKGRKDAFSKMRVTCDTWLHCIVNCHSFGPFTKHSYVWTYAKHHVRRHSTAHQHSHANTEVMLLCFQIPKTPSLVKGEPLAQDSCFHAEPKSQ